MPKFSIFSGDSNHKGDISFEQWVFEVKRVMQAYTEATLRNGLVWSLHRTMADLVWYLGLQAPMSEIINKLEHLHGTVISFNILMQYFYKMQQRMTEKVPVYVTHLEGTLNVVQQEYPAMLSMSKFQRQQRDHLFHNFHMHFCNSMCYLYDDPRILYPQLITAS